MTCPQGRLETARPYQLELLEAALEENTVVNLGSGAGKTFIAVMLIKELSPRVIRSSLTGEGLKRTIFLVPTLSLVRQQAEYIEEHTSLTVGQYTGDKKIGKWTKEKWDAVFESNHVLVMIVGVFLDLLLQGRIQFRQINLLILDECHLAVKDHEYIQVMRRYKDSCDVMEPTRFLGLTASLIPSKCKPGDLVQKIKELEQMLCSQTQTARDLTTNQTEECYFTPSSKDLDVCRLKIQLEDILNFLENFPRKMREGKIYEMVKLNFEDCLHVLTSLGIWCSHQFACKALEEIVSEIRYYSGIFRSDEEKMLIYLGHTKMKLFKMDSSSLAYTEGNRIHMTDKVHELLLHLKDYGLCMSRSENTLAEGSHDGRRSTEKLRGIIFIRRRTIAMQLKELLQKEIKEHEDLQHISCDSVVGHGDSRTGTNMRKKARMNVKKVEKVLKGFKQGETNLLVATSVVEERVDIPKCNLVIRFDFPESFRSYVQSKGHARAKESQYILLIPNNEEATKLLPQLHDYKFLAKELEAVCHCRHVAKDEEILYQLRDKVEPYRKGDMAATINSALSLLHEYCKKLPKDSHMVLSPDFVTIKRPIIEGQTEPNPYRIVHQHEEFRTIITLPMSSLVKYPIKGDWFPSKRLADKSAALYAIRELDKAGELDEHLRLVVREEDSGDEQNRREEKSRPHAGTEKASNYYKNKVAPALVDCHPVSGVEQNYLYILLITDTVTGKLHSSIPGSISQLSFGILTSKPLPHLQIPEFSIFEEDKEYNIQVTRYHIKISLDWEELDLIQTAHQAIFTEVLNIKPNCLKSVFEKTDKNYLVTPVQMIVPETLDGQPALACPEVYIDMGSCHQLSKLINKADQSIPFERIQWPLPVDRFKNTIVVANHDDSKRLHEVCEVSHTIDLSCPFVNPKVAPTYRGYFLKKYKGVSFTDDKQPALICKALGTSPAYLKLLTSRFKCATGETKKKKKSERRGRTIELFPELCSFYPLPTNLWKLAHCLPSILWRIESILAIDSLRRRILRDTGMGLCPNGSELTTYIKVTGYKELAVGLLKSQKYFPNPGKGEAKMFSPFDCNPVEYPLRSPDNALLLQALTTKGAMDCIDLERLETLGDSFLKFSTTVFLFCNMPDAHEGRLSSARSRRIENFNLFCLAKRKGITDFILSKTFEPRQMWIPPCYQFDAKEASHNEQRSLKEEVTDLDSLSEDMLSYLYHRVNDKGVADTIESLIGAYLVSGGILAGLKFMRWMGFRISLSTNCSASGNGKWDDKIFGKPIASDPLATEFASILSLSPRESCFSRISEPIQKYPKSALLLIKNSAEVLKTFFKPDRKLWNLHFSNYHNREVERLLSMALAEKKIDNIIGWRFRNRSLLLQALTHASYTRNRLTDSYQRLEFLGDAILDYLVTSHIYTKFPSYTPGQMSCMRSALVNNISFADLAVQLRLHTILLHSSPTLMKHIELFLENQSENAVPADCKEIFCEPSLYQKEENFMDSYTGSSSSMDVSNEELSGDLTFDEEVEDISPPKVLGDILESLAGAIFVDSGFSLESVWNIFQPLFDHKINSFNGTVPVAPIQELQCLAPAASMECKKDGRKVCYMISVLRKEKPSLHICARGRTKAVAKNAAAKAVLKILRENTK